MSNPTTPFSWQMPQSTDLVTDLPADFEVFGQAVATSMADLLGGTTGQVLSKTTNADMDFTWITNDVGDITAVTAGTGISGGGTSGAVTITNSMATEITAKGDLIAGTGSATFDNLAAGANGQVLTADSTAATGLAWATASTAATSLGYAAGKNAIINGDFYINQRAFTSVTASGTYTFDRWKSTIVAGGGTTTITPQTFTPGTAPVAGYEGRNFLQMVTASQTTSAALSAIGQGIENVRNFADQTVTISFWAKASSGTPNVKPYVIQDFGTGGSPSGQVYTAATKQTITTSWARYSFNISVPSISGKTIGTDTNSSSIFAQICVSSGTDYAVLSDVGIQNNTFQIWGVQVEAGSTATAFQTATGTIQGELAACQRYYNRYTAPQAYSHLAQGWAISTDNMTAWFYLPVEMRTVPTAIDYASVNMGDGVNAQITPSTITFTADNNNTKAIACTGTKSAGGMTQYRGYQFLAAGTTAAYIGFSAEL